jgi:lipopolysaccharide export system protein LptA
MTWQKKARLGIAAFVVVFVVIVIAAGRQRKAPTIPEPAPKRVDPAAVVEGHGTGKIEQYRDGRVVYSLKFGSQLTYPDGRSKLTGGVSVDSDRNGRPFTITSREAEISMKGNDLQNAHFMEDVRLKSNDLEVAASDASYAESEGVVKIPGPVTFTRGRMKGSGVGATYDRNREVLWLLDKAHITVAADASGQGALEASSKSAGMARQENYIRLIESAHITADTRLIDANEITITLSPATPQDSDQHVRSLELRGNSRISGGGGASAPQAMSANDIDMTYAPDGRTLQGAQLRENGVVQLPGDPKSAGRRVAGKTIVIAMGPDGSTVTSLTANDNVQVDLPAEGDLPAKRIRSASLVATGAPDQGLQNATFSGNVEYRETRPAKGAVAAAERVARSLSLIVATKPGLGAVQQADFHGNVHFTDGPQVAADASRALYHVDRDLIELSSTQEPGPASPRVSDGRVTVEARAIELTLGTRKLTADTKVRSSMQPQPKPAAQAKPAPLPPVAPLGARGAGQGRGAAGGGKPQPGRGDSAAAAAKPQPSAAASDTGHMPRLLKQDLPVTVTSNRLSYDGAAGHATYTGNARLWQGDTSVRGDTIVVDDKSGNLEARTNVRTEMTVDEVDPKTGARTSTRSIGQGDAFIYDDGKRLATYTGSAHIVGSEGDVTGEKIELYFKPDSNELERAEGYGANGSVVVKEKKRTATGARLTYTVATETYLMTGTPVTAIEIEPNDCKKSVGAVLTFQKAVGTVSTSGNGVIRSVQNQIPCPAGPQ